MSRMPLLSVVEVAERLGLSKRRIQQLCEDGRLGQLVGDAYYVILEDELKKFAKIPRNPGRPRGGKSAR